MELDKLDGWIYSDEMRHIEKTFFFKSYLKNISFVNAVAFLSNKLNHHPDLEISFGHCKIKLKTHDLNSVTEKDFNLAREIDKL